MIMTITERIAKLEQEFQHCQQQVQYWTAAQLRTEGALLVVREIAEESSADSSSPPKIEAENSAS